LRHHSLNSLGCTLSFASRYFLPFYLFLSQLSLTTSLSLSLPLNRTSTIYNVYILQQMQCRYERHANRKRSLHGMEAEMHNTSKQAHISYTNTYSHSYSLYLSAYILDGLMRLASDNYKRRVKRKATGRPSPTGRPGERRALLLA